MKGAFRSSVQCGIERGTRSWRGGRQGRGRGTREFDGFLRGNQVNHKSVCGRHGGGRGPGESDDPLRDHQVAH